MAHFIFHNPGPLLRTAVPSVGLAFGLQTVFAVPSVAWQTDRLYDASGALTFLSVTALSLYLPLQHESQRARAATAGWPGWRQLTLSAAVAAWSIRLGSYLYLRIRQQGHDSRFDEIKKSVPRFAAAWMAQATWVSLCLMPVIAVNSVPPALFAALPHVMATDIIGLTLYLAGFGLEIVADRQKSRWLAEKRHKQHEEDFMTRGLWSRCQYPNYFGESTLWTGIATVAAGVLLSRPVLVGLGLQADFKGRAGALALAYISPAFVTLLLTKVSGIPLSERKYDQRYGHRQDYQQWKRNTPKFFPKLF